MAKPTADPNPMPEPDNRFFIFNPGIEFQNAPLLQQSSAEDVLQQQKDEHNDTHQDFLAVFGAQSLKFVEVFH